MFNKLKENFLSDWPLNSVLVFLVALLMVFSLWRLPASPATWFDEGISLGIIKSLLTHGVYSMEVAPGEFVHDRPFLVTNNYPVLLPAALSVKLFDNNLTAARLPMVLFVLGFALLSYLLVKRLYGKLAAVTSLALLVTFVPFYGNGKAVLGEVPGLAYLLAGLLILNNSNERFQVISYKLRVSLAGLFFGLSVATKPFFIIILPAIAIGEVWFHYQSGASWQRLWRLILGAVLPVIVWLWTIVPDWSLSGIHAMIGYYANSYADSDFYSLVLKNFWRFFSETTPLHFSLLGLISFATVWFKIKRKAGLTETEIILLSFVIFNLFWYLKTPGWYRYFFTAHLIIFLFFPAALNYLFNRKVAVVMVTALFLVQLSYLISRRHDPLYNSNEAVKMSTYINQETKKGDSFYIINQPSLAFLLDDRLIYQFLRINPQLFFGTAALRDNHGQPYQYIVGEIQSMPALVDLIKSSYQEVQSFGHYTLYKKL